MIKRPKAEVKEMLQFLRDNAVEQEDNTLIKDILLDSFIFVINCAIKAIEEVEE